MGIANTQRTADDFVESGTDPGVEGHDVHFYETEAGLADVVGRFLAAGLRAGEPGVVIATEPHAAAIRSRLAALDVDAQAAVLAGRLRFIEAQEMIDELWIGPADDFARFRAPAAEVLERAGAGCNVRVYGETADILWRMGRESAASSVERMWNELAAERRFSLLCGYSMSGFRGASGPAGLRGVCRQHRGQEPWMRALAEQHQIEAELRDRNADLSDLLENATEGLHCVGADGTILWANRAQLAMLGYAREEYAGRPIAEFHVDADVPAQIRHRLAGGDTVRDCEAWLRCKDGSIKKVRINANAQWQDDKLLRTRCFIRDVTSQEVAGEEMSRLMAALVEAGRAKDEFIAMLSHELRGPLASIRSALQLMQLRGDGQATREQAIIDRQVENLVRLVDDLLDASRIAAGKLALRRERLDLADIIDMAVEIVAPVLAARGQALRIGVTRRMAFVDGDPVRLAQVIANLLSNAAKYTARGGRISLDLERADGEAAVSVRDTGIGIDADLLPRIFERGVQGRHGIGGLGLGLTIVRAIVELHGGAITAFSDGAGRGSEFRMTLPLADATSAVSTATAAADAHGTASATPIRLLIVDDDADLADTMAELLAGRGFITHVARDAEEALHAFARFRPQAALIDISLPKMDGHELARRLRAAGTDAKLVALSGYGRREDEEASVAAGFDVHLVKPVRADVIEAQLHGIAPPGGGAPA